MKEKLIKKFGAPILSEVIGPAEMCIFLRDYEYLVFIVGDNIAAFHGKYTSLETAKARIVEIRGVTQSDQFQQTYKKVKSEFDKLSDTEYPKPEISLN